MRDIVHTVSLVGLHIRAHLSTFCPVPRRVRFSDPGELVHTVHMHTESFLQFCHERVESFIIQVVAIVSKSYSRRWYGLVLARTCGHRSRGESRFSDQARLRAGPGEKGPPGKS